MRNFIFSFLALILLPAYISGQVVKGKVLDSSGMGVPTAFIVVGNSSVHTYSDIDGSFSINAKVGDVLNVSLVGFDPTTATGTAEPMLITLIESADTALKEVVVIGYGTAKKRDLTGSIVKVQAKEIADKPNPNPITSVQGK